MTTHGVGTDEWILHLQENTAKNAKNAKNALENAESEPENAETADAVVANC